jgi:hypothetical protein
MKKHNWISTSKMKMQEGDVDYEMTLWKCSKCRQQSFRGKEQGMPPREGCYK